MDKRYKAKEVEEKWMQEWEKSEIYKFDQDSKQAIYSIDTPPPYVSSDHLHLGHAMSYIQAEIIIRFKRMQGYNIFYPMGFDDNGLPTERFVEKKHKINKTKISRKEFIDLCIEETKKGAENYRRIWKSLGVGVDWSLEYNTIGKLPQRIAQRSFIDLYSKGLIYQDESPTFWCTNCKTALAQADLEDEEEQAKMYYIKFLLTTETEDIVIATTRPEMLPACVALYVNPDDNRFLKLLNSNKAVVPIFNFEVPIFASEEVDPEFGTGIMMVCTWGDAEDVKKWKTDKLDTKILIDDYGRLTEIAGEFQGLKLDDARKEIVRKLKEYNFLVKEEEIAHVKNVHERCGTPVEFITSKQWFIKVLDFKDALFKKGEEIKWYPEFMKDRYDYWVLGLKWDWCISRDRYYGVPFPVWHCQDCAKIVFPKDKYLPVDPRESNLDDLQCVCGSKNLIGEKQVMDTWMTSSLTPLINAKWQEDNNLMDKIYPMSTRVQAFEIIRTWLFYTVAKSLFHTNSIPWKSVMISGWGLDEQGKKMSKSKGNITLIDKTITEYSADAIRWWSTGAGLGQSLKHSDVDLKGGVKIANKLWNVARFIQPIIQDWENKELENIENFSDQWILTELQKTIFDCTKAFEVCDFNKARIILEKFFWLKYCDIYLELCKDRTWNPEKYPVNQIVSLKNTLKFSIENLLKLFAPILPFVTEEIYHILFEKKNKGSIHIAKWPEIKEECLNKNFLEISLSFMEIINKIRHFKTNITESFKSEIKALSLITENVLLQKALSDLSGLAKAEKSYLNEDIDGEVYDVKIGKIILKK